MKVEINSKSFDKAFSIAVIQWAKMLEAEECIINKDGTVSLYCKDGCICENYLPTKAELMKARK